MPTFIGGFLTKNISFTNLQDDDDDDDAAIGSPEVRRLLYCLPLLLAPLEFARDPPPPVLSHHARQDNATMPLLLGAAGHEKVKMEGSKVGG